MKVLCIGNFDPIHEGHIDHIFKASLLGDYLIVAIHPDENVIRKKGYVNVPLWARAILVRGILEVARIEGAVCYCPNSEDITAVPILAEMMPEIFAKGGDRVEGNIPQSEVDFCDRAGIRIVYGVGGLLNSSTKIHERCINDK